MTLSGPGTTDLNPPRSLPASASSGALSSIFDTEDTDAYEAVSRVERGISADSVAAQLGRSVEWVHEVLRSDKGRDALNEMRAHREYELLTEKEEFARLRSKATRTVAKILDDPDASYSEKLKAANTVFDRDPDRLLAKVERKEVLNRHEIGYDRNSFMEHLGEVLGQVGVLPPQVLEAKYSEAGTQVLPGDTSVAAAVSEEESEPSSD